MPKQCKGGYSKDDYHYLRTPDGKWLRHHVMWGGPLQLDPMVFQANSYDEMEVHFNVGDRSNPSDWSVVAWGESGPVYVYHNDGD